jgi:hypothetical protein
MIRARAGCVLAIAATLSCRETTVPNFNNASAEDLTANPTVSTVSQAVVGLQLQLRGFASGEAVTLGIFGKESYVLTASETQWVTVFLGGPLQPGSFNQDIGWSGSYLMMRQGMIILGALDKLGMSEQQKEGIRGFTKTLQAMALFSQVRVRDDAGIVIDVSADPDPPIAPVVSKQEALARCAQLLDEAKVHLQAAGGTFVFKLHSGFALFSTPATFIQFNRAVKARVDIHRQQWSSALADLAESFTDTSAGTSAVLRKGAYNVYSISTGDGGNGMLNANWFVHPTITTGAQRQANGQPDLRLTQKVAATTPRTVSGVTGTSRFVIYPTNVTDVPIIRNEELILIRAEARYQTGDVAGALNDINFIRVNSGGLAPLSGFADSKAFVDELLYNRTYSLLFEGGHRWVDARRYGRLSQLPKINTVNGHTEVTFPYIMLPDYECTPRNPKPAPGCAEVPAM